MVKLKKKEVKKVTYNLSLSAEELNVLVNLGNFYLTVSKSVPHFEDFIKCGSIPSVEDSENLLFNIFNLVKDLE